MRGHAVLIAGAGPTGLTLAGELALAGVDVAIVERRPTPELAGSRAGGLHAHTIELFELRGLADRFLAKGKTAQVAGFAGRTLDIGDFPTRHPYGLGLWQNEIERVLVEWVEALGVPVYRGCEIAGLVQDEDGVDMRLANGTTLRARYLVGCDGGRSIVRKSAGIAFPGWEATTSSMIAQVEMTQEPELGIRHDALGRHALGKVDYDIVEGRVVYKEGGKVGVMLTEKETGRTGDPTFEEVREALIGVYGTDFGMHSPTWISRFTDATRQAATYRDRRVLLAGDAAHIHAPDGGQGLNIGVHDAMNLGWKLAQVVHGLSPDTLLDTYHAERHPVGARVLRTTMAAVALRRPDERTTALREAMAELLGMDEPRKRFAAMLSGLDIRYDLGEGHPLLGRRVPDMALATHEGPVHVSTLMHAARPVLLNLGRPARFDIAPWAERVCVVDATCDQPWELPVLGEVPSPSALLIRPDGYVAWVEDETGADAAGLKEALTKWVSGATPIPIAP